MGVMPVSVWQNEEKGLHSVAWHVREITGNSVERALSDDDFDKIERAMIAEGWHTEDAGEFLEEFCVDAKVVVEELREKLGFMLEDNDGPR